MYLKVQDEIIRRNIEIFKIICGEVLEHVADHTVALREMMRVLQPGGTLIISTPNLNANATVWGRFLRLIGVRSFKPITEFSSTELANHGDAHVREFSKKTMRDWLEGQNLDVTAITTASFIDGPAFDTLLKIPLRIPPLRWLIIVCENLCSWTGMPFGRHLIVKAFKK